MRRSRSPSSWADLGLRTMACVIGVTVVALSLGPPPSSGEAVPDKVAHLLSYFSFTSCALLGFVGRPGRSPASTNAGYLAVALIVAAGGAIELLQALVGRDTSLLDALANAAGAALGLALWGLMMRRDLQRN